MADRTALKAILDLVWLQNGFLDTNFGKTTLQTDTFFQ